MLFDSISCKIEANPLKFCCCFVSEVYIIFQMLCYHFNNCLPLIWAWPVPPQNCYNSSKDHWLRITITKIITTKNLKYYENYQKVTEIQRRKHSWKNGTNEFPHHGVATNIQFVKNQVSAKCNKLYHNKMRYACIVDLLENVLSVPQFICGIKTISTVTRLCDSLYQLKSMISILEMNRYPKRNHLKQL